MKQTANHPKASIRLAFSLLATIITGSGIGFSQQLVYDSFPTSACPEVRITEKYDHISSPRYRAMGWDTVVTCDVTTITLSSEPYIPVQYFNGTYKVTQIPFNPPDNTFYVNYNASTDANNPYKKKLAISSDDAWAPSYVNIAFPFYFFGVRKNKFLLGDNGIVTFATPSGYSGGGGCPFATTTALPWTSSVPTSTSASGSLPDASLMRDAIYGVYEDTYTGINGAYMSGNQGVYYGVIDEFPCRKIIASWNQIPVYSDASKRQTYQIVCYEGSNIIEVHVKKRNCCSSTNGGNGLIGIQNASGQPQQPANPATFMLEDSTWVPYPNAFVQSGKPASFTPSGYNVFTSALEQVAFRFTPQGSTQKDDGWYRVFDDGRDPIPITSDDPNSLFDTNTYAYVQRRMNPLDPNHPTLTKLVVSPKAPKTKYMMRLRFQNANRDWYDLRDTIVIGRDTLNETKVLANTSVASSTARAQDSNSTTIYERICYGRTSTIKLSYPAPQLHQSIHWERKRILNGVEVDLPENEYTVLNDSTFTIPPFDTTIYTYNKIDTLKFTASVDYVTGCSNYSTIYLLTYPNFDITITDRVCKHTPYHWSSNNHTYSTSNVNTDNESATGKIIDQIMLHSQPGCDSLIHLDLTVYDVSRTVDHMVECHPITWQNGRRYTESNTATYNRDTIIRKNVAGCDSVVQLDLTVIPLTPRLSADLDEFDYDHLTVNLTDISTGNDSRTWVLPNGNTYSSANASYTIPAELDEADIKLIAYSPYGCFDSTHVIIPFNKETFWVPNIFTPDDPQGNAYFGTIGTKTHMQKIQIFNRRGEMVYECECEGSDCNWDGSSSSANTACTWDGRDLHGEKCPQAAYVYIIRYSNEYHPDKTLTKVGTITLLR